MMTRTDVATARMALMGRMNVKKVTSMLRPWQIIVGESAIPYPDLR